MRDLHRTTMSSSFQAGLMQGVSQKDARRGFFDAMKINISLWTE
jgi:hypothetical protein